MTGYYLATVTVPIPEDKLIVIRDGKKVEYEIDRTYIGNRSTRVKRKVIGKVDPVQPGRMFPNEFYFELFPENEVPEEVREEFLRACAIKRSMAVVKKNPEEIIDGVVKGLEILGGLSARNRTRTADGDSTHNGPSSATGGGPICASRAPHATSPDPLRPECFYEGDGMNYTMLRRVFDEIYYAIEELAGKFPNEVIVPFKVERINEVLEEIRKASKDDGIYRHLRLIEEGLTYSDVLLLLKWYKVLPR